MSDDFGFVKPEVLEAYPSFIPFREAQRPPEVQAWWEANEQQVAGIMVGFYSTGKLGYHITPMRDALVKALKKRNGKDANRSGD